MVHYTVMSTTLDPSTADATLEYPKARDLRPNDQLLLALSDGDGGVQYLIERIVDADAILPRLAHHRPERLPETL